MQSNPYRSVGGVGTSNAQTLQNIEQIYKDDLWENSVVEAEFLETPGRDIDFDQINEENMTYSRYGGSSAAAQHQQQSQNIISEDIDTKKSINTFNKIAEDHEKERFQIKRSRQAQIGQRLHRIREEIYRLEKELNNNPDLQQPQQEQQQSVLQKPDAQSLDTSVTTTTTTDANNDAQIQQNDEQKDQQVEENKKEEIIVQSDNKQEQQQQTSRIYLDQLDTLKDRLQSMYQTKGFQVLAKNQQHLRYLGVKQGSNRLAVNINQAQDGQIDVSTLEKILLKLQRDKTQDSEEVQKVALVVDRSKQDIGTLIRLYNLQKRLNFIKHVTGEWKPTNKYKTITEQIEYVQKRMELLDAQKLQFMQSRTKLLSEEILNLQSNQRDVKDLGHNKEEIEELYKNAIKVKHTMHDINKYIERLEQKRKLHDMSAKVAIDIQCLEEHQNDIQNCVSNNEKLFDYIKGGMSQNMETIKKNLEFLKNKAAQSKQVGK
eukprot:403331958